ncbi:MAG: ABC transporter permease [Deltaproteobacteria bacterium]|nr:ABC transporter permease [Deltaproteobacteria bacterium]
MIGFLTLIEREFYRFSRLAAQTIVPPVITTLLFILIFGYSLGGKIESISGFHYIVFILPGLVGMGVITNSYSNTSTSLFMARMDRSIENVIVMPLSSFRIVMAFVIGGVTRGVVVGGVTLLVAKLMTGLPIHHLSLMIFFLLLISSVFSSLGVISALLAEDWDHLATFSTFVITPFIYLGGTFYSVTMLPGIWKKIAFFNPMFYFIDSFRWSVLGVTDLSPWLSGGVTLSFAFLSLIIAILMFRRGYKLVV